MKLSISAAVAIAFGGIVLAGYFLDIEILRTLTLIFLHYAAILAAIALLIGLANLFMVHWRKATKGEKGGLYSVIVLISFGITILVVAFYGPTASWSMWIFNYIQIPIETSLMALLVVILIFASIRLVRKRMNWFTLLFLITALIILLGSAPIFGLNIPFLNGPYGLRSMINQIPVAAGARGLLFGVALGTIATGLRILIGTDRPYGG